MRSPQQQAGSHGRDKPSPAVQLLWPMGDIYAAVVVASEHSFFCLATDHWAAGALKRIRIQYL